MLIDDHRYNGNDLLGTDIQQFCDSYLWNIKDFVDIQTHRYPIYPRMIYPQMRTSEPSSATTPSTCDDEYNNDSGEYDYGEEEQEDKDIDESNTKVRTQLCTQLPITKHNMELPERSSIKRMTIYEFELYITNLHPSLLTDSNTKKIKCYRRMIKNRQYAKESRDKRKYEIYGLKNKIYMLEEENLKLKKDYELLQKVLEEEKIKR